MKISQHYFDEVMGKSKVAYFFDSQHSIHEMIKIEQSYNYMLLNSDVMFL